MRVLEIHGPSAWRGFSRVAEDLFGSMSLGGLTCSVFTVCTARAPYLFRDANVAEPNVRHNRAVLRPSRTSEGLKAETPKNSFIEIPFVVYSDGLRR
jgi:hypothetical protein